MDAVASSWLNQIPESIEGSSKKQDKASKQTSDHEEQ